MTKFEVLKRTDGEYYFNLRARNGEIILTSEGYTVKSNCIRGIESVRKNSQIEDRFETKISANGKLYFNLKATNGRVIGVSELYETASGRSKGMGSVRKNAPYAEIVDLTE